MIPKLAKILLEVLALESLLQCQGVVAQGINSPFQSHLTMQNSGENAALTVHRNPFGKPCLSIEAASRSEVVNPHVYNHVVSVYNTCSSLIKVRLCYYHSDQCIDVEVSGGQRKDTVLGIYPHIRYFRYSYKEKF
jgi:hypothetical protein